MPAGERAVSLMTPLPEGYRVLWIRPEIDACLIKVRLAIERHVEGHDGTAPLSDAMAVLQQLQGVAEILPWVSLRLSFEGMAEVLSRRSGMVAGGGDHLSTNDVGLSAVLSGCVLIPDYLDLLARGQADSPLLLLPLINELRLAVNRPLVSESAIIARQLALHPWPARDGAAQARASQMPALARKASAYYQSSLLAVMREQSDARAHWGRLGKLSEQLAAATPHLPSYWLWTAMAAVVEAVLTQGLDFGMELRRQLGTVGQQLKLLGEQPAEADAQAAKLATTLMYFVARALPRGRRVMAAQAAWRLFDWVPDDRTVERRRAQLQGPNARLLAQVTREIKADLTEAKDAIDLAVRTAEPSHLETAERSLSQVADTLRGLGLRVLGGHVARQCLQLGALKLTADVAGWEALAANLLRVESSLERELFGQLGGLVPPMNPELGELPNPTLEDSRAALISVALGDIARARGALDTAFRRREPAGLADVPAVLERVALTLPIIDQLTLATALNGLAEVALHPALVLEGPETPVARLFALILTRVELTLEALRDGLDIPAVSAAADPFGEIDLLLADLRALLPAHGSRAPVAPPAPEMASKDTHAIDPELREIFGEEAGEVLMTLNGVIPAWLRQPERSEALVVIRRAFHTLKGSGRMVGADDLADYAWAVERVLNAVLDSALDIRPDVIALVTRAHAALPTLIARFRDGEAMPADVSTLIEDARLCLDGPRVTPEMRVAFVEDAGEKIDQIGAWLQQPGTHSNVPDPVIRAFHTLRGASGVVGLASLAEVAAECEHWLDGLRAISQRPDAEACAVLAEVLTEARAWVATVTRSDAEAPDAAPMMARLRQVQTRAPEAVKAVVAARELVDIFSMEALDLIDKTEALSRAWAQDPERDDLLEAMQRELHTLAGSAAVSGVPALAHVARALQRRLGDVTPGPGVFAQLPMIFEAMMQLLDAYRDGRAPAAAPDQLERIARLGVDEAPQQADLGVTADAKPPTPVAAGTEVEDEAAPPATSDATLEAVVEAAVEAEVDPDDDQTLEAIFFAEAHELLDAFDDLARSWSLHPEAPEPATETQRVLHTLKGSARMAGYADFGDVASRLEIQIKALQGQTPPPGVFSRLTDIAERLQSGLRALQHGSTHAFALWDDAALDLRSPAETPAEVEAPIADAEPVATLEAAPFTELTRLDTAGDDADQAELLAIFSEEASELIDALEAAFGRWRQNSADASPRGDLLRALHTLKGGAGMCGWSALSDRAHALETELERQERAGQTLTEPATLNAVGQAISDLAQESLKPPVSLAALAAAAPSQPMRAAAPSAWDPRLFFVPEYEADSAVSRQETARVAVERLDGMLNEVGEASIIRARLEAQMTQARSQLNEMAQSVDRLRDQLRQMDAETDAQIRARGLASSTAEQDRYASDFDPLEMDRYTRMQELSRSLNESLGDIAGLQDTLNAVVGDSETLLVQQNRVNTQLQQGLMGTLMVPFSRQIPRLQRVVRSTALELGKQANLQVIGEEAELDRNVLERMTAPLEHLLRNAVVHGIETPEQRAEANKPPVGLVTLTLQREGSELLMVLSDDGGGLDHDRIEAIAVQKGLLAAPLDPGAPQREIDLASFIFEPGFSTAATVTQAAGRGIGMDVVAAEVKQLGGTLGVVSTRHKGARFQVRLPLTLAVSHALLVRVAERPYALPLANIEGVVRVPLNELPRHLSTSTPEPVMYGGSPYQLRRLSDLLGVAAHPIAVDQNTVQAVMLRASEGPIGGGRTALLVDAVIGNREIVAKPLGPIVSAINGISSATILPDGQVVLILDAVALAQARARQQRAQPRADRVGSTPLIMVVDDSITIRRVTQRLLTRNGLRVVTAKDGLDAMAQLATVAPAAILLDIEMPRADGFEVASYVRNTERLARIPIVMITSRSGDKHRSRAEAIGVNRYLIKPYQEGELMDALKTLLPGLTA
ncbi:Hpt domain-containing protein [Polycyclovorans algicola]|uniref:Hpt domain-containing protein n=1 Tax=Polycyclovorans algicola TaxID=616992 RepID=UPI0005BE502D|nr:Hpt domain-containing protein [Polycyclovorans algicola]